MQCRRWAGQSLFFASRTMVWWMRCCGRWRVVNPTLAILRGWRRAQNPWSLEIWRKSLPPQVPPSPQKKHTHTNSHFWPPFLCVFGAPPRMGDFGFFGILAIQGFWCSAPSPQDRFLGSTWCGRWEIFIFSCTFQGFRGFCALCQAQACNSTLLVYNGFAGLRSKWGTEQLPEAIAMSLCRKFTILCRLARQDNSTVSHGLLLTITPPSGVKGGGVPTFSKSKPLRARAFRGLSNEFAWELQFPWVFNRLQVQEMIPPRNFQDFSANYSYMMLWFSNF